MLRLLTFGSLSVHGDGGLLAGSAAQPRRLAVLVMVARGGKRADPRSKLLGSSGLTRTRSKDAAS